MNVKRIKKIDLKGYRMKNTEDFIKDIRGYLLKDLSYEEWAKRKDQIKKIIDDYEEVIENG